MASGMDDLQSRLARVQQEIEEEKRLLAVNQTLEKLTREIGEMVAAGIRQAGIDMKHLNGKMFRCQVDPQTETITSELVSQTGYVTTHIAKATIEKPADIVAEQKGQGAGPKSAPVARAEKVVKAEKKPSVPPTRSSRRRPSGGMRRATS